MVQWHTISPPRAHWKPSWSSWSPGRATDSCVGMTCGRSPSMGGRGTGSPPAAHGRVVYAISGGFICNADSHVGIRE